MNVGIVGAGLIGARRAEIVRKTEGTTLCAVADTDLARAQKVAQEFGGQATARWQELVGNPEIQIVIVATPNHLLSPIALEAVKKGKHVLVEKPMGRTPEEVRAFVLEAKKRKVLVKGGFNHRYHPALRRAKQLASEGAVGTLVFIRSRYGHGGRPGYEKEWRCNPEIAGGGELLDQGIHLIDLGRWFLGDFEKTRGLVGTGFWPISPLEDNAFALLRTEKGQIFSLHSSWTQWKNLFSFEIYGTEGSLTIEGLGGSYGTERLIHSRRRPASGPPEEKEEKFPGPDISWQLEWTEFIGAIQSGGSFSGTGEDGLAAIQTAFDIYRSAQDDTK